MAALPIPYQNNVSLPVGSSLTITGTPNMPFSMKPEMEVDFFTGTDVHSDIAFQFRVYFGNCVVMNSRQGGIWGQEVKFPDKFFKDGEPFELVIQVLLNEYQVTVNGVQCHTFPHRLDPASVKMILVWRDVFLTEVTPHY